MLIFVFLMVKEVHYYQICIMIHRLKSIIVYYCHFSFYVRLFIKYLYLFRDRIH
jgi:hypothetical protein